MTKGPVGWSRFPALPMMTMTEQVGPSSELSACDLSLSCL